MQFSLRDRVQARLNTLGINRFQAAEGSGLNKWFFNDILTGKKKNFRDDNIEAAARALDCDPEYLQGRQEVPRLADSATRDEAQSFHLIPVSGICEIGVWRDQATPIHRYPPVPQDIAFSAALQSSFLARGDGGRTLGIEDGDVLIAVSQPSYRDGDLLIVRREKAGAGVEISARRLMDGSLVAGADFPKIPVEKAKIVGLITSSYRTLRNKGNR